MSGFRNGALQPANDRPLFGYRFLPQVSGLGRLQPMPCIGYTSNAIVKPDLVATSIRLDKSSKSALLIWLVDCTT
jgi:hypothetical protein